ncbi:helix-turn-helix transcriptional regulator [Liquorilactobacillus oeni]|uniref:HTH cro/C1-type domain-containing protein n=1 Tax=Liquorilactobacillus oeni DSM 19972 TaxID=1423777 RepID=A0A0R1MCF3_9LACO|nr:helix-turn-helix transcriptional regulator [Liquorilactobacillus oeni]KRL05775.1 hypothetical protein FD46_GL000529 [Liquorilactobacillus oeni DSM 19972]
MILGNLIKEEREKREMTQEKLANTLNVNRQAVSKWETGTAYPDIDRLIQISELFNVSLDSLIKNDDGLKQKIIIDKSHQHPRTGAWEFMRSTGWMMVIAVVWIIGRVISTIWGN